MTQERKVLIYGGSGYTGKLIAECLAQRGIPFYFAGRTRARLETALEAVRSMRKSSSPATPSTSWCRCSRRSMS